MHVKRWVTGLVSAVIVVAGIAFAKSGGPAPSKTAAPAIAAKSAEPSCLQCHGGATINTGGTLALINPPPYYIQGATYTFSVRLSSTQTSAEVGRMWGFQLTAVRMADGEGVGTFADVAGQGTKIVPGTGSLATRRYIEQSTNEFVGVASPVEWQVQWTAPNFAAGNITFYATGLAANGNGSTSGDFVYSTSHAIQDVTATETATWGKVKGFYR